MFSSVGGVKRLILIAICLLVASCNGSFGGTTILSTSGIKNVPGQLAFRIVGTVGTPFSGIMSDGRSSWPFAGTIPTTYAIVNGRPPFRMIATKTASNSNLMSIEIINGFAPAMLASTVQPFGTISAQFGGTLATMAPRATPDVRFVLRGPKLGLITGSVEDLARSYAVEQHAPTVFLFDAPDGRVDGVFLLNNLTAGPLSVALFYTASSGQPTRMCQANGAPDQRQVILKYPGCTAVTLADGASLNPD
ncbi:MAG: hypothetical protein IVW54_11935 [Candidatus Binataceae bacterium]|nr:hypothetical protein [Candidatus Binataceae bacterium]